MTAGETRVPSGVGHHEKAATTARQPAFHRLYGFPARSDHVERVGAEPASWLKRYSYQLVENPPKVISGLVGAAGMTVSAKTPAQTQPWRTRSFGTAVNSRTRLSSFCRQTGTSSQPALTNDLERQGPAVVAETPDMAAPQPPSPRSGPLSCATDWPPCTDIHRARS